MTVTTREARACAAAAACGRRSPAPRSVRAISVFRSNRGISAQLIDDVAGRTIAAVNWTEAELRALAKRERAKRAGELMAERAQAAGVEHGRLRPRRLPIPRPGQGASPRAPARPAWRF